MDWTQSRRETPGCRFVTHLNNAGASLMPRPVIDTVLDYIKLESHIGGYEAARERSHQHQQIYNSLAQLLNAEPDEIALLENATRAWDMLFYAIPFRRGDRILTSVSEYGSNYIAYLQVAKRTGARIETIPNDESGQTSPDALREMIDERVKLVAISHIPTNGGLVNPAREIGEIAKSVGAPFLLDACQSVGQMPMDVRELGCDMLTATGRKYLRAPRGTGFLYVSHQMCQTLEPPFLDVHAATWTASDRYEIEPSAKRFENWESNMAGKMGLGAAVDYAESLGLEAIWQRIQDLGDLLRTQLSELPGVRLRDLGLTKCGIVSFEVPQQNHTHLQQALAAKKYNISVSERSSTRLDLEARHLSSLLRASLHYYNTELEICSFCNELKKLIST